MALRGLEPRPVTSRLIGLRRPLGAGHRMGGPRRPGWSDGGLSLGLRPVFAPAKAAGARSRSSVWRMGGPRAAES